MKNKCLICILLLFILTSSAVFAEEPDDNQSVPMDENLSLHFLAAGETPVITETGYLSENLSIEISMLRENRSDIYVADIWVRDINLLRRGFGGGKYRTKMQTVAKIAAQENAILALTGDNGHNFGKGYVYANGTLLQKKTNNKRDICLILTDGSMEVLSGKEMTAEKAAELEGRIWQSFLFGPGLFDDDGKAITKFSGGVSPKNPRAVIGYYEPGHYCLVQVDGRGTKSRESGKNVGLTLKDLAAFMESLGCKEAYNLDGGQSALMWFNGKVISNPYHGGRNVGDIVYVTDKPFTSQ